MSGTTSRGFRYPDDTDKVFDGGLSVRNLANDVNTKVGAIARGSSNISLVASNTGTVVVNFPAGRFSSAPTVTASGSSADLVYNVTAVTATQATLSVYRPAGAVSFTSTVYWIAVLQ